MNGKLKAIFLLGAMFVLGFAGGSAWQRYRFHHMDNPHTMFAEHRLKRLAAELKLSPAQEEKIRDIFQKAHERAVQVNDRVAWDLADIHRDTINAIRQVITPEQQVLFEKHHQNYHKRHKNIPEDSAPRPAASKKS